jgi:hypothetical protein
MPDLWPVVSPGSRPQHVCKRKGLHHPRGLAEVHPFPETSVPWDYDGQATCPSFLEALGNGQYKLAANSSPLVGGFDGGQIDDRAGTVVGSPDHAQDLSFFFGNEEFCGFALVDLQHGVGAIYFWVAVLLIGLEDVYKRLCVCWLKISDPHLTGRLSGLRNDRK